MLHETIVFDDVSRVTNRELIAELRRLVRSDQVLNAQLLVHLGEVDARGLYREHAYPSMFAYCFEGLGMSEAQAYLRIQAARLSRQFPRILELVAHGALNLSAIKLLAPHLTADNHVALLEQARGKGKREVEVLVAAIAPKPDVPNRIRKLPEPSSQSVARAAAQTTLLAKAAVEASVSSSPLDANHSTRTLANQATAPLRNIGETNHAPFTLEAPRARGSSTPLSPGRYKVEFTAGQALHDKLAQLKDLLRHQVPDGDLAVLVERAVDLLIEQNMKRRFAQIRAPKRSAMPRTAQPNTLNARSSRQHAVNARTQQPRRANSSTAEPSHPAQPHTATPHATTPHTASSRAAEPNSATPHATEPHTASSRAAEPHAARSRTTDPHTTASGAAHLGGTRPGLGRGTERARMVESSVAPSGRARSSRYIPRAVIRAVHERDGGRCTFVSLEGKRCSEQGFLELHHHEPHARGGEATVDNLRLVCRAHNALFAERDFGRAPMRSKRTQTRDCVGGLVLERGVHV
jgi:hypothetical protein